MPRRPDMPPLHRSALADDPIEQFRDWYERAEREVPLAEAMTLATVDAEGAPDARMVLLKGFGPDGVSASSPTYESAKARAARGRAASGAGPLLARARPPGAGSRPGGAAARGGVRRVLRHPPARLPDRRLGLAAERGAADREALDAPGRTRWRSGSPAARSRGPPHWGGYLVRPGRDRVLAGPGRLACTTASATRASRRRAAGGSSARRP